MNQFANTGIPETAPRDATLYILADNGSRPGRTLYSKVILDSRLYQPVTSFALNHFTVDLSADPIGALPDTVHIALGDAGGDQNYLVLGPADYATENLSHFGEIGGPWARLWDIRLSGDNPDVLMDTVVPIRARFVLSTPITSAIAQQAVPAEVALEPNYPNPFNPNTTIRYHLPLSGHVRLQILDVLGRPVAVLADGPAEAGTHEAGFSGEQLSSGVYFLSPGDESGNAYAPHGPDQVRGPHEDGTLRRIVQESIAASDRFMVPNPHVQWAGSFTPVTHQPSAATSTGVRAPS